MEGALAELAEVEALLASLGASLRAPASPEMIADAERRLSVRFSPSLRAFLLRHNGFTLGYHRVLGVPPVGAGGEMFDKTLADREWARRYLEDEDATEEERQAGVALDHAVAVHNDPGGDGSYVLCGRLDERGECPVAEVDHETGEIISVNASSYARFLWFLLDGERRRRESPQKEWYELPWPEGDPAWVLQQDPHLARWRSL